MHFQALNEKAKSVSFNTEKYATEAGVLREELKYRFLDLESTKHVFEYLHHPLN
jgi:hypothetical protein